MTREEAINKVRQMSLPKETMEILQALAPELRESEDERIRKFILEVIKTYDGMSNSTKEKCISYLEKQKERGPLTKEEEYTLHRIIEYLEDETCPPEWISLLHDIYCLPYEKHKENPKSADSFTDGIIEVRSFQRGMEEGRRLEKQKEEEGYEAIPVESTLEYKLGFKAGKDSERQKEQKPAEWSEEDEAMIKSILFVLESYVSEAECEQNPALTATHPTYYKEIDWLKSLRPQYHGDVTMTEAYKMGLEAGKASSWKPSEDEERLINTSISFLKDFADKGYENAVECIDWLKSKLK